MFYALISFCAAYAYLGRSKKSVTAGARPS
jgi:hypothetical protein